MLPKTGHPQSEKHVLEESYTIAGWCSSSSHLKPASRARQFLPCLKHCHFVLLAAKKFPNEMVSRALCEPHEPPRMLLDIPSRNRFLVDPNLDIRQMCSRCWGQGLIWEEQTSKFPTLEKIHQFHSLFPVQKPTDSKSTAYNPKVCSRFSTLPL